MAFYAKNFTYDGTSSEIYGLVISSTQNTGEVLSSAGSNISIQEDYVLRRETPYFYGVSFPETLQFDVEFYSEEAIPRQQVSEIEKWLFGLYDYKVFEVIQEDMKGIYYNCLFINPTVLTVGNFVRGFHATCVCDAPWAWGETVTHIKSNVTSTMTVNNLSDNSRYTKPIITLTFDSDYDIVYVDNTTLNTDTDEDYGLITDSVTSYDAYGLVTEVPLETEDYGNLTDLTNNAMIFENVTDGEIIIINTDLKTITSNKDSIMDRFNGKYLWLIPNQNIIEVTETISEIQISYTPAKKVGS